MAPGGWARFLLAHLLPWPQLLTLGVQLRVLPGPGAVSVATRLLLAPALQGTGQVTGLQGQEEGLSKGLGQPRLWSCPGLEHLCSCPQLQAAVGSWSVGCSQVPSTAGLGWATRSPLVLRGQRRSRDQCLPTSLFLGMDLACVSRGRPWVCDVQMCLLRVVRGAEGLSHL